MAICERCNLYFTPVDPRMIDLCEGCVNEIIADREDECPVDEEESTAILEGTMTCLKEGSEVQNLLDSPGVTLTLAKLSAVSEGNISMLTLNAFRVGAYLAFKQAKITSLLEK